MDKIYGIGISSGEPTIVNGKHPRSYNVWFDMLRRCYSYKWHEKYPSYINCYVCNEWKYYKEFIKWYNDNYYSVDKERMNLDKDILNKGNKIYSPENCIFVPQKINKLFVTNKSTRGNLPIGVEKVSNNGFRTHLNWYKTKHSKTYSTPEEAFYAYKEAKEKYIKEVADEYKDKIPDKLYEAMYKYEVDIDD